MFASICLDVDRGISGGTTRGAVCHENDSFQVLECYICVIIPVNT